MTEWLSAAVGHQLPPALAGVSAGGYWGPSPKKTVYPQDITHR